MEVVSCMPVLFFIYYLGRQAAYPGGLAQLARALAWHARGHRFDPDILHYTLLGERSLTY